MKVLIACEYSGTVRDAFRELGHDAWSCDIIPTDADPTYHIIGDALELLNQHWDLLIAHPPCTYLSNAAAGHLFPKGKLNLERYEKGLLAKEFFMKFLNADIDKICVENPIPSRIYNLPPYTQITQPYYFGEPFQKRTCLWLKNLPKLEPTNIVPNPESTTTSNWYNKGGKDRAKNRAKFFKGMAKAMAEQWGGITR